MSEIDSTIVKRPSSGLDRPAARFGLCVAICHDLRAPMATAGAAIHTLATRWKPSGQGPPPGAMEDSARLLEIARQSLAQVDALIDSLPGLLSSADRFELRRVELAALIGQIRDDLASELRLAGGKLRVMGSMPSVLADPERLRIALRNLVGNAIRYRRSSATLEVTIRAWRRGSLCTLTVSDNGAGMRQADCARLLGPASRLPAARGSANGGLGLTIVRQAIEAVGGTVTVTSRRGIGTSFAITLRAV